LECFCCYFSFMIIQHLVSETLSQTGYFLQYQRKTYIEIDQIKSQYHIRDCCGCDRIVVGFITTYAITAYHHWSCEFEPPLMARCACDWTVLPITRICFGKVIQLYSFILQHLNNKEILQVFIWYWVWWFMVFNVTFNNISVISWRNEHRVEDIYQWHQNL
jgi:hypothetical protein